MFSQSRAPFWLGSTTSGKGDKGSNFWIISRRRFGVRRFSNTTIDPAGTALDKAVDPGVTCEFLLPQNNHINSRAYSKTSTA